MTLCEHCKNTTGLLEIKDPLLLSFLNKKALILCYDCKRNLSQNFLEHVLVNYLDKSGKISFVDKISDQISSFIGSWKFVMSFLSFLAIWIILNSVILINPIDKFPFILLNLFLSCLASFQAPFILLSQNRREKKDRLRSQMDYTVDSRSLDILKKLEKKLLNTQSLP
jgi:uncharacterized membrane protein